LARICLLYFVFGCGINDQIVDIGNKIIFNQWTENYLSLKEDLKLHLIVKPSCALQVSLPILSRFLTTMLASSKLDNVCSFKNQVRYARLIS